MGRTHMHGTTHCDGGTTAFDEIDAHIARTNRLQPKPAGEFVADLELVVAVRDVLSTEPQTVFVEHFQFGDRRSADARAQVATPAV